ncbi:TetR/AcrR family transcriptional regulator C-terminal domain-containing protein [Streptomyces pseudovenezuelae]|uniref:TetR/AcrR family transcriptional regulator C-terminal domain-containing protein n=1 Tax=Streptomyces pseudovenezuelae TaxID=67350 RepID=UPI002E3443C4|nr:TetR/AcrR family transcriptional regulator C-terminal domain-containing protein [Streptomyces pseudovenezuelae]
MTSTTGAARDALRQEIGSRPGNPGAALYWHIKSTHDLLLLAVDSVWGRVPLPCLDGLHWHPALLAMADHVRSLCVRHPWLLTAMAIQPLDGPAVDRHDRHLLAVCEKSGLTRQDAEQAAQSIIAFTLGSVLTAGPDPRASFGLQSILDGVEARLPARA